MTNGPGAVEIDVEALLQAARELEPLPESATRLASLVAQPEWELEEIVQVISLDPSLTGKLLGMANSVIGGSRTEVRTVRRAVNRLGSGTVVSLAIATCVRQDLADALPVYGLGEGDLFRHSVTAALAAEKVSAFCAAPVPPESYAAALLHDVGKLVLARNLGPRGLDTLGRVRRLRDVSWHDAEQHALRIGHAQLGRLVAESWGLPDSIAGSIGLHHEPDDCPDERTRLVCRVVALADVVAKVLGEKGQREKVSPEELVPLLQGLGLSRDAFRRYVGTVQGLSLIHI